MCNTTLHQTRVCPPWLAARFYLHYTYVCFIELFHMTLAKSAGGKTNELLYNKRSPYSGSVVWFNAWLQLCVTLPSTIPVLILHDLLQGSSLFYLHHAWPIHLLTSRERTLYIYTHIQIPLDWLCGSHNTVPCLLQVAVLLGYYEGTLQLLHPP